METVLDFRSFDERFKTALIFSIFEGLLNGKHFTLISNEAPASIQDQFKNANVMNIDFSDSFLSEGSWKTKITKKSKSEELKHQDGGCCGLCVGEKR